MAGIIGYTVLTPLYGATNPNLSTDLDDNTEAHFNNDFWDLVFLPATAKRNGPAQIAAANNWGIIGTRLNSFKNDYYERIHILPNRIELGTVASTVVRQVSLWNAYNEQDATLNDILISNGAGITVVGEDTPNSFNPLQEKFYDIRISPNGPPEINAQVLFDFSDVNDPLPVVITGNRAVVLPAVPDVPVIERWKWLTDIQVSSDGTEQRIGLLNVPRRTQVTKLVFESEAELRDQYKTLFSASGRLFIPYFQYGTTTTAAAAAGDTVLLFDTSLVDLRDDDYVLLMGDNFATLIQLDAIGSTSASTKAPLSSAIPKGTKVIAIFASIIPNNLTLNRPAVNNYGTMSMSSSATYPRSSHTRPGASATLSQLAGYYVLERRPLANDDIGYSFDTGQDILDAKTGLFDVITDWDFTKVETGFSFNIRRMGRYACTHRSGVDEMDYWRLFADEMKGSLNNFLLSTYRPDQLPAATVGVGANSMILLGPTYVDNFWPALAYHYIAINTAARIHYAEVTAANKNAEGNVSITFNPSLPSSAGWDQVKDVSYLLKQRITDDTIELEHYALDTILKFNARTVKE